MHPWQSRSSPNLRARIRSSFFWGTWLIWLGANDAWARPGSHRAASIRICDRGAPQVAERLRSELELLKFRVKVSRDPTCNDWIPERRRATVTVGTARTTIGYVGRSGVATVDVADRNEAAPDLIALATVELLRARLLYWPDAATVTDGAEPEDDERLDDAPAAHEMDPSRSGQPEAPSDTTNSAADEVGAHPPTSNDTWSVELGPSWLVLGSNVPTTLGIYGQCGLRLLGDFVIAARGSAGFTSSSFAVEGGRMEYRIHNGALLAQYRFALWQDRVELRPMLGIGFARGSSVAYPDSPNFLETDTSQWSLLGLVQAGVGYRPFTHFAVVADVGLVLMQSAMTFQGSQRDPSIGGENAPERPVALPRLGAQLSAGLRVQFWRASVI